MEEAAQHGDALLELVHAGADRREVDAVGVVLDLGPAGADAHRGAAAGDQVDGRDGLGQHGRVAVADRVDERADLDPLGLAGQGGVHRHGLEAGGVVGLAGRPVEVVPDRDPVEAEGLDPLPQQPQLVGGRVLEAGMDAEPGHVEFPVISSERSRLRETARMPRATVATTNPDQIEIEYDTIGSPDDPALLLVMGFTAQSIAWDDAFCEALRRPGRYVIRFDNRDCGLTTHLDGVEVDLMAVMQAGHQGRAAPAGAVLPLGHVQRRRSGCSTPSTSSGPTSSGRRWAG